MSTEPQIPWARIVAFVRQHTHDVRNGLNCLDLESSLLRELVTDEESRQSVERVRSQVRTMANEMRSLSAVFTDPQPAVSPITARDLLIIWREQCPSIPQIPEIDWVDQLGDGKVSVNVDVEMMVAVFRELLDNAADFSQGGKATVTARHENGKVIFELREPKTGPLDTSGWGQAFATTRRGGYGLGLWSARRLLEANGASLLQAPSPSPEGGGLLTRITIPAI